VVDVGEHAKRKRSGEVWIRRTLIPRSRETNCDVDHRTCVDALADLGCRWGRAASFGFAAP
jgi:hypothetical protein